MKNRSFRAVCALLAVVCLCGCLTACGKKSGGTSPSVSGLALIHEPEFGGIYIKMTIDDFNALGFEYGDSVKVAFSNGFTLDDLPYYNGYYTLTGSPLLIAYPGYDYIKAAINSGDDLWAVAGVGENDTAEITLDQRGKYADIQSARDIHYTDDRAEYAGDEVFANFRSISAGNIKENFVYRSASPCDDQHNRASYTDALMSAAGVRCVLDLSDTHDKIQGYVSREGFASPYFLSLYDSGRVIPIALNMNYGSDEFKSRLAGGLLEMSAQEGPYLIHCTEGKDRTGFVCMLIEALAGASYEEIVNDYMITYDNYYGITEEKDPARYKVIVENVLEPMISSMAGDDTADIKTADLCVCAEAFLRGAGMTESQVRALKAAITG